MKLYSIEGDHFVEQRFPDELAAVPQAFVSIFRHQRATQSEAVERGASVMSWIPSFHHNNSIIDGRLLDVLLPQ